MEKVFRGNKFNKDAIEDIACVYITVCELMFESYLTRHEITPETEPYQPYLALVYRSGWFVDFLEHILSVITECSIKIDRHKVKIGLQTFNKHKNRGDLFLDSYFTEDTIEALKTFYTAKLDKSSEIVTRDKRYGWINFLYLYPATEITIDFYFWGPFVWSFRSYIAESIEGKHKDEQIKCVFFLYRSLVLLPCWFCVINSLSDAIAMKFLRCMGGLLEIPQGTEYIPLMECIFHNRINQKLNKPHVNCPAINYGDIKHV